MELFSAGVLELEALVRELIREAAWYDDRPVVRLALDSATQQQLPTVWLADITPPQLNVAFGRLRPEAPAPTTVPHAIP